MIINNKEFNKLFYRIAEDSKNRLSCLSTKHKRAAGDMRIYENYYLLGIKKACLEMLNLLKRDSVFLDFGSGVNLVAAVMSNLLKVYACDILKEDWCIKWWAEMSKKYGYFQYIISREENVPHPDNFFDGICLYAVLEHIGSSEKEIYAKISEFSRVLKKGGYLFIFRSPQKFSYIENLERLFKVPCHKVLLTPCLLKQAFLKNGLTLIKFEKHRILPDFWPINFISKIQNRDAKKYQKFDNFLSHLPLLNFFAHALTCVFRRQ